jgi:hypothetical protein
VKPIQDISAYELFKAVLELLQRDGEEFMKFQDLNHRAFGGWIEQHVQTLESDYIRLMHKAIDLQVELDKHRAGPPVSPVTLQIRAERQTGLSLGKIAKKCNVPLDTVRGALRRQKKLKKKTGVSDWILAEMVPRVDPTAGSPEALAKVVRRIEAEMDNSKPSSESDGE